MELLLQTPCGSIRGIAENKECRVFRGIRYARANRWEYPSQITHWDGIYEADHFGAASYQPRSFYNEEECPEKAFYHNEFRRGETYDYSEDCLFLNIWTPEAPVNAPVIFYIHGGGFKGGCGYEKHFNGAALCKKGVIVVTINYRLGPLGFCCLPQLKDEAGHTGNYALYDQLCALQWVHDNISYYGGNPENITLMGQSAGAMSVQQLCCSPLTKGLAHRAVMLSGGGISKLMGTASKAEEVGDFWKKVMEELKVNTLKEFRQVSPENLIQMTQKVSKQLKPMQAMAACGPVIDGKLLPQSSMEAAKKGEFLSIPYLTGSTSEDIVPPIVQGMARKWALLQNKQNKCPSYTYFFSRQLPGDDNGAWHSSDLWYVLGTLNNCWRPMEERDRQLSDRMTTYLANFAKTGNPNQGGSPCGVRLPVWQPITAGQRKIMMFTNREDRMGCPNRWKLVHTMLTKPSVGE